MTGSNQIQWNKVGVVAVLQLVERSSMETRGSALGGSIATKIGARSLRDPLAISRMQEIAHAGTRSKKPHCCGSSDNALRRIAACGQTCWLEDLSRRMMTKGKFSELVAEEVCGVTERMANAHARDLCGPQCQAGLSAHEMDARGVALVNPALTGCPPPAPLMGKHQREERGYRDLMYVEPRIGSMTISTMPEQTIAAVLDHGDIVAGTIEQGVEEAHEDEVP